MFLLLSSKLRRKLLTYSFTHPDETYYVAFSLDVFLIKE